MEDRQNTQREFLRKLQLEYLTHKLRAQVYREEQYANIAKDIAEKKKIKIQMLGAKFSIETIFDDKRYMQEFINGFFWNMFGLPNLQYKDDEQRRVQGNYDAWYLLYRGVTVMCDDIQSSVISNNPSTEKVIVMRSDGVRRDVTYNEVVLINDYTWD